MTADSNLRGNSTIETKGKKLGKKLGTRNDSSCPKDLPGKIYICKIACHGNVVLGLFMEKKEKYVVAKFNLSFVCFRYLPRHQLSSVDLSTMAVQTSNKVAKIWNWNEIIQCNKECKNKSKIYLYSNDTMLL